MDQYYSYAQFVTHYGLHFLAPGLVAFVLFPDRWQRAWLIMLATMLVDLDHLFADPIFDRDRCSIGYHYLHTQYAIAVYFVGLFFTRTRILATGLLLHMFTDWQNCLWM